MTRGVIDHKSSANQSAFQRLLSHRTFKAAGPRPTVILFCIANYAK